MSTCSVCKSKLDPRSDVRYSAGETMFCSPACVVEFRRAGGALVSEHRGDPESCVPCLRDRLAAVLALCDFDSWSTGGKARCDAHKVRAAATGETP